MNTEKRVLAKYDIRGIQTYVFHTNKLREIRAVQNLPEMIIFEKLVNAVKENLKINIDKNYELQMLKDNGIEVLDKAGGNAFVIFKSKQLYLDISKQMAFDILKDTYSLRLVYTCVECTNDFYKDYENLNKQLGTIKSQMPEVCHIGAFPVCRRDDLTGYPISCIRKEHKKTVFLTEESELKEKHINKNGIHGIQIDDMIRGKGVDSHIAVIHIDGNNMGNRINEIIKNMSYNNAAEEFKKIHVRDSFEEVCKEMEAVAEKFRTSESNKGNKDNPIIYAVIQAGDDITYITRADIAISFTKMFLEKVSDKYIFGSANENRISACGGIAFCKSHFPFSDAYELAEKCCASAKKRAKENKSNNEYIGNWIDFEICTHIRNIDLQYSREKYGQVENAELNLRPYCVKHPNYENKDYDFEKCFENYLRALKKEEGTDELKLNRSRAKELRNAYVLGKNAVNFFKQAAVSRNYRVPDLYKETDGVTKATLYDAIEIMDLYTDISECEEADR